MGVMVSLTALATVFVLLRLFVRIRLLRNVGMDDYLIGISMVSTARPFQTDIHPAHERVRPRDNQTDGIWAATRSAA